MLRVNHITSTALAGILLLVQGVLSAADPPTFEEDIAPLLKQHCSTCHNPQARKAELDVSSAQGLFSGGESGLPIVPIATRLFPGNRLIRWWNEFWNFPKRAES